MIRQFELVDRVTAYIPNVDEALLNRAYVYAVQKHGNQERASGDPYFSHPIEVAAILTELKLDIHTIVTGLLHDTLEDTTATIEEITDLFGEEIAMLVSGVTKLSEFELKIGQNKRAENFRKLLIAMAHDIRILIVKLADRLHNMRTLHFIESQEKRWSIAQETLDIYAPLAGRMGMQEFREELENIAFKMLNPEAYGLVMNKLQELTGKNGKMLDNIAYDIRNVLDNKGLDVQVIGRQKQPFSIWKKMNNKSVSLEQLSDIFAFRVLVNDVITCYMALGIIHQEWLIVPGHFKDYISIPKTCGYQSLHTTIIGPDRKRVEVQIKTHEMHHFSETGVATHWVYKEKESGGMPNVDDIEPFKWLQNLVEKMQLSSSAEEFMEHTKMELFHDQIYCFTPKGRLIALPHGSTVLDFAYAVHTQIGHSCVGACLNGHQVPLITKLKNGDEVKITRSDQSILTKNWEQMVVTGKARIAIRHELRDRQRIKNIRIGKEMVKSIFKATKQSFNDHLLERALVPLQCDTLDQLYLLVGCGELTGRKIISKVFPDIKYDEQFWGISQMMTFRDSETMKKGNLPVIGIASSMKVSFAQNTFSLPGDDIVGITMPDDGVVIYPVTSLALGDFESQPERWVDLKWDRRDDMQNSYPTKLDMTVINQIGTLGVLTHTIAEFGADIINLVIVQFMDDFSDLQLELKVRNLEHIEDIMAALKGSRLVHKMERVIS